MFRIAALFMLVLSVNACTPRNTKANLDELLAADSAFSAASKAKGMNAAFTEYMHPEAVLLRPNSMPVTGSSELTQRFNTNNDEGFTLTWEPLGGDVSSSADLGFTYGKYRMELKDSLSTGTYVSVWKKNGEGKWKWVLDSGNEGTGE
jgi:ketosteroid isomerase-like protein